MGGFDVRPVAPRDRNEIHGLIDFVFGLRRPPAWFQWKHVDGPWGPSFGWVAEDANGLAGVRLFTPWRFRVYGEEVSGLRVMDGAVHPRARRQGLFSHLVEVAVGSLESSHEPILLVSTSAPASRAAYGKLGWDLHDPIQQTLTVSLPGRSHVEEFDPVSEPPTPDASPINQVATSWDSASVSWRCGLATGYRYVGYRSLVDGAWLVGRRSGGLRPRFVVLWASGERRSLAKVAGVAAARSRSVGCWWSGHVRAGRPVAHSSGSTLSTYASSGAPGVVGSHLDWPFADAEGVL